MSKQWLYRVDDRLVHGQVCVGWAETLGIPHILLVDDAIVNSDFEREIYACCPGPEQSLAFLSILDMADRSQLEPNEKSLVVLASLAAFEKLLDSGAQISCLTLGGLHDQPGAHPFRDALYLTDEQVDCIERLLHREIEVLYQPLPGNTPEKLSTILKLQ
jgi:mannose/fructose/N-acetylgalactosamine-specific phosphotransferase system component IIB